MVEESGDTTKAADAFGRQYQTQLPPKSVYQENAELSTENEAENKTNSNDVSKEEKEVVFNSIKEGADTGGVTFGGAYAYNGGRNICNRLYGSIPPVPFGVGGILWLFV